MAVKLILAPEAEQDITEAYGWHEGRRLGLGEEFLSAVEACLESIRRNPMLYAAVYGGYRRGLVRRFPYSIFYEIGKDAVSVYAVFHAARDPEKWRERLI
jgi:plasmid stabilization system protein ParE